MNVDKKLHDWIHETAYRFCDVKIINGECDIPGFEDAEAISHFDTQTIVLYMHNFDTTERVKEVVRHELYGHMIPRLVMGEDVHSEWCIKVARRFAETEVGFDIADLYETTDERILGDEIVGRICETEYSMLDEIKALCGHKAAALRAEIRRYRHLAVNMSWASDYKGAEED